ncbi:cysteine desulfurase family protein [Falsirhodobacter algicola]|uniref:Cysteine desulfurase n=1 Tax=Falsirhodobacter algicola TaxID=2692330 RepID=A0A8J8SM55_9RHOB|nr:cysteine desulfurase family protein [Falsirhodobacter algicola]QUS37109.1 aminotransferase class V-fold PLP-dependent enzyme [Falsirhodobacter algicola]
MVYLDNNATTRPAPEVVAAVMRALETDWANPSSVHGFGQTVARTVATSREQVAGFLGVRAERVVFTSGATEANEAVLRHHSKLGAALVTSTAEHPAVAGLYFQHKPQLVRLVQLDEAGRWRLDALETALNSINGPKLIALAWANGETGVLQDLAAIKAVAERYGAVCLVDGSQAVGRVALKADDAAYLTLSGHKLHGPKGIGVLVQPEGLPPVEIAVGGGQERGWRGGTLNVPGIVGLGIACEFRHRNLSGAIAQMAQLRDQFEAQVSAALPEVRINGADAPRVPNTSNLTIPGVDGMALVARLETRGILCSQVSACSSGQPEPSRTLLAMGRSHEEAFASLRVAVSVDTMEADVEIAAQIMAEETLFLREVMGGLA